MTFNQSTPLNILSARLYAALREAPVKPDLQSEKGLHRSLKAAFDSLPIEAIHEHSLSSTERVDFFVPLHKIAVEVKLRPSGLAPVIRQVIRYAGIEGVSSVLLVSIKPIDLPPKFLGKQVVNLALFALAL